MGSLIFGNFCLRLSVLLVQASFPDRKKDIITDFLGKKGTEWLEHIIYDELCKGAHFVDLGESFQTHIYLQNLASIPPRTSPLTFARSSPVQPGRCQPSRRRPTGRVAPGHAEQEGARDPRQRHRPLCPAGFSSCSTRMNLRIE